MVTILEDSEEEDSVGNGDLPLTQEQSLGNTNNTNDMEHDDNNDDDDDTNNNMPFEETMDFSPDDNNAIQDDGNDNDNENPYHDCMPITQLLPEDDNHSETTFHTPHSETTDHISQQQQQLQPPLPPSEETTNHLDKVQSPSQTTTHQETTESSISDNNSTKKQHVKQNDDTKTNPTETTAVATTLPSHQNETDPNRTTTTTTTTIHQPVVPMEAETSQEDLHEHNPTTSPPGSNNDEITTTTLQSSPPNDIQQSETTTTTTTKESSSSSTPQKTRDETINYKMTNDDSHHPKDNHNNNNGIMLQTPESKPANPVVSSHENDDKEGNNNPTNNVVTKYENHHHSELLSDSSASVPSEEDDDSDDDDELLPQKVGNNTNADHLTPLLERRARRMANNNIRMKDLGFTIFDEKTTPVRNQTKNDDDDDNNDDDDDAIEHRGMLLEESSSSSEQTTTNLELQYPGRHSQIRLLTSIVEATIAQLPRKDDDYIPAPLFIYGASGTAKTCLTRALVQRYASKKKKKKKATNTHDHHVGAAYVNCATLAPSSIEALAENAYRQIASTFQLEQQQQQQPKEDRKRKLKMKSPLSIGRIPGERQYDDEIDEDKMEDLCEQELRKEEDGENGTSQLQDTKAPGRTKYARQSKSEGVPVKAFTKKLTQERKTMEASYFASHGVPLAFGRSLMPFIGRNQRGCAFLILDNAERLLSMFPRVGGGQKKTNYLAQLLLLPKALELQLTVIVISKNALLMNSRKYYSLRPKRDKRICIAFSSSHSTQVLATWKRSKNRLEHYHLACIQYQFILMPIREIRHF